MFHFGQLLNIENRKTGMTLLEVIIYLSLLTILFTVIFGDLYEIQVGNYKLISNINNASH